MPQPVRTHAAFEYADWKAPSGDSQHLIWPAPERLIRQTLDNQLALDAAEHVRVQNAPLPQLRRLMRKFLGHPHERPLIATGHQTELYHPGVWVKNALIDSLARKLNGRAVHFGVDTDHPKHLMLRWPEGGEPISDDPHLATAAWSGLLRSPSPEHVRRVRRSLDAAASTWSFAPVATQLLDALADSASQSVGLSWALVNAQHFLDRTVGLGHDATVASPLFDSQVYLTFVHHLLARADALCASYNAALQGYRDRAGIAGRQRPMPDLTVSQDAVEIPFWLDDLSAGARSRPSVFRTEGVWTLSLVDGRDFAFDPSVQADQGADALRRFLREAGYRMSPRALTLTMFLRLFVADQFVHGIGGGRYDQVTDQFIAGFFGIAPPRFSVTTATLLFPDAVGRQRVCVPCIMQEGHRLRHDLLGERKTPMLERIRQSPRKSQQRQAAFIEMHQALRTEAANSDRLRRWRERMRQAIARERYELTLFDRELPYVLQPLERLESLVERINAEISNAA